jgi:hypothetical protein
MNKTAIIIGSLAIAGIGAYVYFASKKDDTTPSAENLATQAGTVSQQQSTNTPTPPPAEPAVKPITPNDLIEVAKLKDAIIADINKRNSYRKASSRANVQSEIDKKLVILKTYGFSLNTNNELIKTS